MLILGLTFNQYVIETITPEILEEDFHQIFKKIYPLQKMQFQKVDDNTEKVHYES